MPAATRARLRLRLGWAAINFAVSNWIFYHAPRLPAAVGRRLCQFRLTPIDAISPNPLIRISSLAGRQRARPAEASTVPAACPARIEAFGRSARCAARPSATRSRQQQALYRPAGLEPVGPCEESAHRRRVSRINPESERFASEAPELWIVESPLWKPPSPGRRASRSSTPTPSDDAQGPRDVGYGPSRPLL